MKETFKNRLLTALACISLTLSATAYGADCPNGQYLIGTPTKVCKVPTPEEGLVLLEEGNTRYVAGTGALTGLTSNASTERKSIVAGGQMPFAIVLTCSDSRVPPEILFDRGLGEIFVVRVAGNVVDPHQLGSIEYAVEHLGAKLIISMGHTKCGAVKAAYDDYQTYADLKSNLNYLLRGTTVYPFSGTPTGIEGAIKTRIDDYITANGSRPAAGSAAETTLVQGCIADNLDAATADMVSRSTVISTGLAGELKIHKGMYDISTGAVTFTAYP